MARVPYVDTEVLSDDYEILHEETNKLHNSIDAKYWNSAKTVRAFGNNPELADLHVHTNVSLWTKTGLSSKEVELVILAVARELDSKFVWHAHTISAIQREGIPPETVFAISNHEFEELNEKTQRLVRYVVEFVRETGRVSDMTHRKLNEFYNDGTIVGVAMLAGFYIQLHHVGNALDINHDEEFVGWDLEKMPSNHERYG